MILPKLASRIGESLHQAAQVFLRSLELELNVSAELKIEHYDLLPQVGFARYDHFRRRRWRRSALVSDEIGDGKIDFMADCRDDRNF